MANDSFSASGDGEGGGGDTAAHTRVDEIVERLQEHLFGSVPCYCYQNMVDIYLEVLTDIINNSKALYR